MGLFASDLDPTESGLKTQTLVRLGSWLAPSRVSLALGERPAFMQWVLLPVVYPLLAYGHENPNLSATKKNKSPQSSPMSFLRH